MVLAACTPHEAPAAPASSAPASGAPANSAAESVAPTTPANAARADPFAFGVEYTELGLAAPFGAAGVRWAKTRLEAFAWGAVEPVAPIEGHHTYNWSCTDALVAEYQKAG